MRAANEYLWGDGSDDESNFVGVIASSDSHYGRPGMDPLPRTGAIDGFGGGGAGAPGTAGLGMACTGDSGVVDFRWREAGLAAVWVNATSETEARDRTEVYDSLKRRWTYGTTGAKITLDFRLTDALSSVATHVAQGGAVLANDGSFSGNANFPEHDIGSPTNHTTDLEVTAVCPPAGETLETVELIHGYGSAGSAMTWQAEDTWDDADFVDGCLTESVRLINAGTVDTTRLSVGKNIYYVKVKTVPREPIVITSTNDKLRVGTTLAGAVDCALTQGSWLPGDYASDLETDLDACGVAGRDFAVVYDGSVGNPLTNTDYRFTISATGGNIEFDLTGDAEVEDAAAMIGLAAVDRTGASSYTGDDQVQPYENAEFAWSSPVWVDYTGD